MRATRTAIWAGRARRRSYGIMVTAAAQSVPEELLQQLAVGGQLVLPLEAGGFQRLMAIRRTEDGFEESDLGAVVFVPMLSGLA